MYRRKIAHIYFSREKLKRKERIIFFEEIGKDSSAQDETECWKGARYL